MFSWTVATSFGELKLVVQLDISQRAVAVRREDRLDDLATLRPAEIQRCRNAVTKLVVRAHVIKVGELRVPVRRPALKAERPRLKRAAAGVPKIGAARQPEAVNVAANQKLLIWSQHHLRRFIGVVHRVEKRESVVLARRWQDREECPVRTISGILVAARVIVAAANPRPKPRREIRLPTTFR